MQGNQKIYGDWEKSMSAYDQKTIVTLQDKSDISKVPRRSHVEKGKQDNLIPLKLDVCILVYIGVEV